MAGLSPDELSTILRQTHDTGHGVIADRSWRRRLRLVAPRRLTGPVANAILITSIVSAIVVAVSLSTGYYTGTWWRDVLTEAHGVVADSVFLLVGMAFLTKVVEKRQSIERQRECIDDLRGSTEEAAKRRTVGAVRRLNRLGVTDVDLVHCHLSHTDLRGLGFKRARLAYADLRGATVVRYLATTHGARLTPGYHDSVRAVIKVGDVERNFGRVLPSGTQVAIQITRESPDFSGADVSHALFSGLDLRGACFDSTGAHAALFDNCDLEDAAFAHADLTGALFAGADLTNVDLSHAVGITVKQLSVAKSLRGIRGLDPGIAQELSADFPHLLAASPCARPRRGHPNTSDVGTDAG